MLIKTEDCGEMMKLTPIQKAILFNCLRQGLYFVLCILFALSLRILANYFKAETFKEFGIIENIQLFILFLSATSFGYLSVLSQKFRPLLILFSSLCLFAFCRELDSFFDTQVPFISWKFCYLFPLTAGVYLFYMKKKLKKILLLFCTSPAFYIMCSAMLVFIPLAQAIGNKGFISTVLPDAHDVILMRRFFEESGEVLAYFLLFLSSVEFYISLIHKKK